MEEQEHLQIKQQHMIQNLQYQQHNQREQDIHLVDGKIQQEIHHGQTGQEHGNMIMDNME